MSSNIFLTRVTDGMRFDMNRRNLMDIVGDLNRKELELSTGRRVNLPSDDPLAATRILNLGNTLNKIDQYRRNLDVAAMRLGHLDTVLSDLNDITNRAREIYMTQVGDTASEETRANAALEVANLLDEAMDLANRMFDDRYLFGGNQADRPPFEVTGSYVTFQGTPDEWVIPVGANSLFASSVNASEALGARSAEILGRADLSPALQLSTRLADLNGGEGVRLGRLLVGNGTDTQVVDLSGAVDLQDVADRLNATGLVTASLSPDRLGLQLTAAGGDITVAEVDHGHTAGDLGLLASNAGASFQGNNLNAILRGSTLVADLNGGAGVDPSGLTINNGDTSVVIDLSDVTDLNDLFSRVNKSGAHVNAELNDARDGINFVSLLNGAEFTLDEAGGGTAADLGLLIPPGEWPLAGLNGGFGINDSFGEDFTITLRDGSSFNVDVSNASTLSDVVNAINNATGNNGSLTAGYGVNDNLVLADNTGGAGTLSVTPIQGSRAALYLGIEHSVDADAITGDDLNPAGIRIDGLFNGLITLRDTLAENDQRTMLLVGDALDRAQNLLLDARADVGGRINRLELAENRYAEQAIQLGDALSQERDVDFAEATMEYQQQQVRLQAALSVIGMIANQSLLDFIR